MAMYFIDIESHNPWRNLAVEQYLAARIKPGDVILYLWQNARTIVIGRNQNALVECNATLLESEGGYLARRTTGGGAVYHDLGNLCFTFLASPEMYDLKKQFSVVVDACASFGVKTELSGRNDVVTEDGFKFSGNAFSHTSTCDIHHGTIMLDVSVDDMKRYLTPSAEKLRSKGVKSVRSRVCNLRALNPEITMEQLKEALRESFGKIYGEPVVLDESILDDPQMETLYEKFSSREWRYGKTPDCEQKCHTKFDWGEVEVWFQLHQYRFSEVKIYSDTLDVELPEMIEKLLLGRWYDQPLRDEDFAAQVPGEQPDIDAPVWTAERIGRAKELLEWVRTA